jgi:hypothetical protein
MAKGKYQGAPALDDWSPRQIYALKLPFPKGVDLLFRSESDAVDDFVAAYDRASAFTLTLGDTRVAFLWKQALEIGLRAGRGGVTESVRNREASEDHVRAHEAGLKEGRAGGLRDGKQDGRKAGKLLGLKEGELIGFEKGKAEGLSEGKRLGFVAGRDFGEKQATKLSNTSISDRVLVDVGTDSPLAEITPPPLPPSTLVHASTQTDAPPTVIPSTLPNPSLSWADESYHIYAPDPAPSPLLPPRDFSALRSDRTSTPFGTLQHRAHRRQKSARPPRCSASRSTPHRRFYTSAAPVYYATNASCTPKPFRAVSSALDWDRDPRLSDLSRVLRSMGWARD